MFFGFLGFVYKDFIYFREHVHACVHLHTGEHKQGRGGEDEGEANSLLSRKPGPLALCSSIPGAWDHDLS